MTAIDTGAALARRFRTTRLERGLSLEQCCLQIGISKRTAANLDELARGLRDDYQPKGATIAALTDWLNGDPENVRRADPETIGRITAEIRESGLDLIAADAMERAVGAIWTLAVLNRRWLQHGNDTSALLVAIDTRDPILPGDAAALAGLPYPSDRFVIARSVLVANGLLKPIDAPLMLTDQGHESARRVIDSYRED